MGRYTGPSCRLCRREGVKLFLKGERCKGAKCAMDREGGSKPPGMHNWKKGKVSEYGMRLREKQKVKRHYGVLDRQFRNYFKMAEKMPGNTGENLLITLERRLDNVLWRSGMASSHIQARQFIGHGHILVNGKKVDIPSYLVKEGDVITPSKKERSIKMIKTIFELNQSAQKPSWVEVSPDKIEVKVVHQPVRSEVSLHIQDQLVVEFCAR